jgi:hypothetical protein
MYIYFLRVRLCIHYVYISFVDEMKIAIESFLSLFFSSLFYKLFLILSSRSYIQLSCSRFEFASNSGRNRNSLSVDVTIDWLGLIRPTLIGCVEIFTDDCCCWFIGLPNVDDVKTDGDAVHVVVTLFLLLRPNVA